MKSTVSWKSGSLGERAGEAAVPGPANFGGSNIPTKHIQHTHCEAWMSSNSAFWRHGVELSVVATRRSDQDQLDPYEIVMGQECPSDSDLEETRTDPSPMVVQSQSAERGPRQKLHPTFRMKTSKNQITDSVKIATTSRPEVADERA